MSSIKVPYILTCMVTGIQKSYTSVDFVNRKIENYGGDESAMVAGYVCKDAKRALKAFKLEDLTVDNVQSVITQLGGTTSAQSVFDLIKAGKLFLTKKVKVHPKTEVVAGTKDAAGKSKGKKKAAKKAVKKVAKKSAKKRVRSKPTAAKVSTPAPEGDTGSTPVPVPPTSEPTTEPAPAANAA